MKISIDLLSSSQTDMLKNLDINRFFQGILVLEL